MLKMSVRNVALLLVFLAFAMACTAPDKRVTELIEKGKARFSAKSCDIEDVAILMESHFVALADGAQDMVVVTRTMARDDKVRVDTRPMLPETARELDDEDLFRYISQAASNIFDGKDLWSLEVTGYNRRSRATGADKRMKGARAPREKSSARDQLEFSFGLEQSSPLSQDARCVTGIWPEWLEPESKFLGVEEVLGRPCYALEMPLFSRTPCEKVWIDVETLHLAKATITTAMGPCNTTYEDWREVAPGMWLPFSHVTTATLHGTERVFPQRIRSIEVNTGLSDDLFDPRKINVLESPERVETAK